MSSKRICAMLVALVTVAAAGLAQVSERATTAVVSASGHYTPPKTSWGDPDLQGTFTSDDAHGVPFERPKQFGTRKTLTEQEQAERAKHIEDALDTIVEEGIRPPSTLTGQERVVEAAVPINWHEYARRASSQTSLLVDPPDGRLPALTEEGKKRQATMRVLRDKRPDSWLDRNFYDRCITRGVAGSVLPVVYGNGLQIVQSPGWVAIRYEMVHETRLIPMDGRPHAAASERTYMGDPRGHWEGSTLVVETTNFLDNTTAMAINGSAGPASSDELKVVEKFTRTAPDAVQYSITVSDPKVYTASWTASYPVTREPGYELFEYACHEGNYALRNMLGTARVEDEREKTAK